MKSVVRPMYVYELIKKVDRLSEPERSITRKGILHALQTKEADRQT